MFEGNHPNGIFVGYILQGYLKDEITLDEQLYLYPSLVIGECPPCSWTSTVLSIDEKNMLITTQNSVYRIKAYEEDKTIHKTNVL